MFLLLVLVILSPTVRRALARVGKRSRNHSPERHVTARKTELQDALEALDGSKQLELHLRFPRRTPGDVERFCGAVEQFLRNAKSSFPSRSTIRVEAYEADDRVHVVISDAPRSDDAGELPEPFDLRGVA